MTMAMNPAWSCQHFGVGWTRTRQERKKNNNKGSEDGDGCRVGRRMVLLRPLSLLLHAALVSLQAFFTLLTARRLFLFLSWEGEQEEGHSPAEGETLGLGDAWALLQNLCLVSGFCLHHSATRPSVVLSLSTTAEWADTYYKIAYAAGTNVAIVLFTQYWQPVLPCFFWSLDSGSFLALSLPGLLWVLHLYSWLVLLVSFVVMDLPDLMGIRPVYHRVFLGQQFAGEPSPASGPDVASTAGRRPAPDLSRCPINGHVDPDNLQKLSPEHLGFRSRQRHGSFLALAAILLARLRMGADRALLAAVLLSYTYARFRPTARDLRYQRRMWEEKKGRMHRMG